MADNVPNVGILMPRISESTYVITIWILFALAIATMASRTMIRLRFHRHLQIDDVSLLFASACLLAATVITQVRAKQFYIRIILQYNIAPSQFPSTTELDRITHNEIMFFYIFSMLIWFTIYAAKFAYLWFFRMLILQLKPFLIYWWVVCTITALSLVASIINTFTSCPHMDIRALQCTSGSFGEMVQRYSTAIMALDVITDLLIVVIPIMIITKVKIRTSQKIGIALFLCFSIVLASICIVRITGLRIKRPSNGEKLPDAIWRQFWFEVEGCLSVTLVSSTAFRTLLISRERNRQEQHQRQWISSALERIRRQRQSTVRRGDLPSIPSATMTGLRSWFQRERSTNSQGNAITKASHYSSTTQSTADTHIIVTKDWQIDVEVPEHHLFDFDAQIANAQKVEG